MSKQRHTPGPWNIDEMTIIGPRIGKGLHIGERGDRDEALKNARLVEAAPDLLAACETALEVIINEWGDCGCGLSDCFRCQLRAAIAKAKGD